VRLDVPDGLQRNTPTVAAVGHEHTGELLLKLVVHRLGIENLAGVDILDVGCGVRFAQTIVNRNIAVKSYTGVEVFAPIVDFLNENLAAHDPRFRFHHWNVRNLMYNPGGVELSTFATLPTPESFDLIWLFSVFTHLNPDDALAMLRLLRKPLRPHGKLFFSAFIDDDLTGFEDRDKENPLLLATYGRTYMESLIESAGWRIDGSFERDQSNWIQHYFVCST
jgi:SAM-dependent methyltransferase